MIIKSWQKLIQPGNVKKMMPWKDTIWAVPFRQYSTQNNSIMTLSLFHQIWHTGKQHSIHVGTSPNWRCPNDMFCIHVIINFRFAGNLFPGLYLVYNIQTLCEPAPQPACMTIKQESKIPKVHTCFKTHTLTFHATIFHMISITSILVFQWLNLCHSSLFQTRGFYGLKRPWAFWIRWTWCEQSMVVPLRNIPPGRLDIFGGVKHGVRLVGEQYLKHQVLKSLS